MAGIGQERGAVRPIALVSSHALLGGSEKVLEQIVDGVGSTRPLRVISLGRGPFVERLRAADVEVETIDAEGRWGIPRAALGLRRLLGRMRPALVHANGVKAALCTVASGKASQVPVVWMKHDFSWDGPLARIVGRRCRLVVGVSSAVLETFGSDRRVDRCVVAPGIAIPEVDQDLARERVRTAVGGSEDVAVVSTVGRLDPIKGHAELLEAAPAILRAHPRTRFLLVGGEDSSHPEYPAELQRRAERLGVAGAVTWLGHRADAIELIAGSDVVAVPTIRDASGRGREGFGLVAVEAMATSTPVVGYDHGALAETLSGAGLLVPPGDRDALAVAVGRLLAEPGLVEELTACGRAVVGSRYSVEGMVAELERIYAELAAP